LRPAPRGDASDPPHAGGGGGARDGVARWYGQHRRPPRRPRAPVPRAARRARRRGLCRAWKEGGRECRTWRGGRGGRPPSLGDERPPRTEAAHRPRYGRERHARARWPARRVRPPTPTVYTVGTRPAPRCQPAVAAYAAQQRIFRRLAKRQRGRRRPTAPSGGRGSAEASRRSRVACGAVRYYMFGRCWRG